MYFAEVYVFIDLCFKVSVSSRRMFPRNSNCDLGFVTSMIELREWKNYLLGIKYLKNTNAVFLNSKLHKDVHFYVDTFLCRWLKIVPLV